MNFLLLEKVLSLFAIVFLGFFIRNKKFLGKESENVIVNCLIYCFIPAFFFNNIIGNQELKSFENFLQIATTPIICYSLSIIIVFGIITILKKLKLLTFKNKKEKLTFICISSLQNYGFLPFPLLAILFADNKSINGVLVIHNCFLELAIWSIGIMTLTGTISKKSLKKIINPPFISIFIALLINSLNLPIPNIIENTYKELSKVMIPLALFCIGISIANILKQEESSIKKVLLENPLIIFWGAVIRLFILPLFLLSMIYVVTLDDLKKILIVQSAMPTALFFIIISRKYGGSPKIASTVSITTSIISVVTIPIWINFWLKYFNY